MPEDEITRVTAAQVLDSRGCPTIEVEVRTRTARGAAIAPTGASKSSFEVVELRDGGPAFSGMGVNKAIHAVNTEIAKKLVGLPAGSQKAIDAELIRLDGTPNKRRLGGNALVATSIAVAKAAAASQRKPIFQAFGGRVLPVPFANVINGGKHAATSLAFQEYLLAPVRAKSFSEGVQAISECYSSLKRLLLKKYGGTAANVGDEGGFTPPVKRVREPLRLIQKAVDDAGWGDGIRLALDVAASSFAKGKKYVVDGKEMSARQLHLLLVELIDEYGLFSVEDPFAENDGPAFADFTLAVGKKVQVVGDDLLATNKSRVLQAGRRRLCNALLVKPNQAGTLTETLDAVKAAQRFNWGVMASHRSGDSEDAFIADFAVGINCGQIKCGAPARGERTAKYNQLLRIEALLGSRGRYAGKTKFSFAGVAR